MGNVEGGNFLVIRSILVTISVGICVVTKHEINFVYTEYDDDDDDDIDDGEAVSFVVVALPSLLRNVIVECGLLLL